MYCGLLVVAGAVAVVRSIPTSYANVPGDGAQLRDGAFAKEGGDDQSKHSRANFSVARIPVTRRSQVPCPECGVVDSVRQIQDVPTGGTTQVAGAKNGRRVPRDANGGKIPEANVFEITIRFRDGSTTVFADTSSRSWSPGNKVILIGPSVASSE